MRYFKEERMRYLFLILVVAPTVSVGQNIEIVGSCDLEGWYAHDIYVSGNYAFIASIDENLQIVNVSDPFNPSYVASYDTIGRSEAIAVSGQYVYLALNGPGLLILDISEIANPTQIGLFQTPHPRWAHDIFIRKGLAYLANCTGGLKIIDVSDPSNPYQIGIYDSLYWPEANGIFVTGDYAYVTVWYGGLYIIDVTDPTDPTFVGNYPTDTRTHGVCVSGDYAYLGEEFDGLRIVNVSDPQNPILTADCDITAFAMDQHYLSDYLYIAHYALSIIDVSDPSYPSLAGRIDGLDIGAVCAYEDYVYAASRDADFYVLSFSCTDINQDSRNLPENFAIVRNHPNPFNASTIISYSLPEQSEVTLSIYNILGQHMATIFDGIHQAGKHTITWDATDFPSGVYFARLEGGEHSENIKMVLLK